MLVGSINSMTPSISVKDLPNLPGIRRDISTANPKLYREFKLSQGKAAGQGPLEVDPRSRLSTPYTPVEGEDSLISYFENQNKLMEYSKSLSAFPQQGGAYNDISGRYSLRSQQQDRLNKSRSLPYCSLDSVPSFVNNNKQVCRFLAHFTELSPLNMLEQVRTRKVEISFHLEDNTIEISEPRINNSGLLQGKMLKRHQITKPRLSRLGSSSSSRPSTTSSANLPRGDSVYTINDFYSGAEIEIYNRVYTIVDCDVATRKFFEQNGTDFGEPGEFPRTLYDPANIVRSTRPTPKNFAKIELKKKMTGFYEHDRKVLRFFGVWDSTSQFFGDELYVRLHYSLATETMEVMPIHTRNSGRDKLAKLLKKTKIMKKNENYLDPAVALEMSSSLSSTELAMALQPAVAYHWSDLHIGMKITVAALDILILDADEFTKEFYRSKNKPLDPPIQLPPPIYPTLNTTIPPHNGFGSEADSLQTCKSSLQPSAPSKDGAKAQMYQGMILRFAATMDNPKIEDRSRSFIIQVHLEDDTVQIREPPIRNSGHKGGIFLARSNLERHDGTEPLKPQDIYLGGVVQILSHKFKVHDADEFTLRFMEENCKQWNYSNIKYVESKLKREGEVIRRIILTVPGLSERVVSVDELHTLLSKGIPELNKQEVVTIFRILDPRRTGKIKLTTLLKQLMK